MEEEQSRHWTLDRKVPLALILAIVAQTVGIVWWAASLSERVSTLERAALSAAPQADRLTRVETRLESVQDGIAEIKALIRRTTVP